MANSSPRVPVRTAIGSPADSGSGDGPMVESSRRVGILGGTFDPVHRGHLVMAAEARRALNLAEVVWVPARLSPHKGALPEAPAEDRARMVELSIEGRAGFRLSRADLDRPAPSYSIDTVEVLQRQRPDPGLEWFFIVGSDSAGELETWRRAEELFRRVRFAVLPRAGAALPELPPGAVAVPAAVPDISSTEIRRLVREGRPIAGLVPEPAVRYIEEHRLYR